MEDSSVTTYLLTDESLQCDNVIYVLTQAIVENTNEGVQGQNVCLLDHDYHGEVVIGKPDPNPGTENVNSKNASCAVEGKLSQNSVVLVKVTEGEVEVNKTTNIIEEESQKGEIPYKCNVCSEVCIGKQNYETHLLRHLKTKPKHHKCKECGKVFTQKASLNRHSAIHSGERPHKCEECGACFAIRKTLRVHWRSHSEEKLHLCELCGKAFTTSTRLQTHLMIHTGLRPHQCELCGTAFSRKDNLRVHYRTHIGKNSRYSNGSQKNYSCSECEAACRLDASGKAQRVCTHLDRKPVECKRCNILFEKRSQLTLHLRSHKPHKCDRCPRAFGLKASLQIHYRIHTHEKPYKCQYCDAAFVQKGQLKGHTRRHTGEKPFVCAICQASFTHKAGLDVHVRKHTGDKPYKCDQCVSAFTQVCSLRVHRRIHAKGSENRPFKCSECGGGFLRKRNLVLHLRVHAASRAEVIEPK